MASKKKKKVSKRACLTITEKVNGNKPESVLLPYTNHEIQSTAHPMDLKEDRPSQKKVQMRTTEVSAGTEALLY